MEKRRTSQSITIISFKKDLTARDWPQLSKTVLAYVKTNFSQWTWESDEWDEDSSTDIINVDMDSSSAGTKSGEPLKLVFPSRIELEVYIFNNEDESQTKAQPHPVSTRQLPHKSYASGCNRVLQLNARRFVCLIQSSIGNPETGTEFYL